MLLEVYDNVNNVSFNLEDSKYICIAFFLHLFYFSMTIKRATTLCFGPQCWAFFFVQSVEMREV